MNKKPFKTVEQTIRELRQRYKNVPSPLSENYNRMNKNVNMVPQNTSPDSGFRNRLLSDFQPPKNARFF